jgi:DNA primase
LKDDAIRKILASVDIVDIAKRLSVDKASYNINICCPIHGGRKTNFRFYPDDKGGHFKCFSNTNCQTDGNDIFSFVQKINNCDFKEALKFLCDTLGIKKQSSRAQKSPIEKALDLTQYFFKKNYEESQSAKYMSARGVSSATVELFGIGCSLPGNRLSKYGKSCIKELKQLNLIAHNNDTKEDYDFFRNRVMFPIHSNTGSLIGFSGRALDDTKPKYLNSSESIAFTKGNHLYNLHRVTKSYSQVIVVEGYMDTIGLWQKNVKNSVSSMGTALSTNQLELLTTQFEEIVFIMDGDKAGRTAAWNIAKEALKVNGPVFKFVFLEDGKDPFDLSMKMSSNEIYSIIDESMFLSDFIITETMKLIKYRINHPEKINILISKLQDLINTAPEGIMKDILTSEITSILNTTSKKIPTLNVSGKITEQIISEINQVISNHPNSKIKVEFTNCINIKKI